MGAYVESLNAGRTADVPWGSLKRSAIDKRPIDRRLQVEPYGVETDEIADLVHHGGLDKAVYAYAREDLDAWADELGRALRAGQFGENLTTIGVDVTGARIGERWRIGTTLLEVSRPRIPCSVFAGFMDEQRWLKRFTAKAVPGAYLRVLEPGSLAAGDAIEVVERPRHDITVGMTFRALTLERHLLPQLLTASALAEEVRMKAQRYVDRDVAATA